MVTLVGIKGECNADNFTGEESIGDDGKEGWV